MTQRATYPSLQGKTIFVTGGASGIGEALVTAFARQGARVGFLDIAADAGEALAGQLNDAGGNVQFLPADVTDIAALQATISGFEKSAGRIDVLVNNAANDARHDWRTLTVDAWDAAQQVNIRHAFFAIQTVAPGMIGRGSGSIINFGSISWKLKMGKMPAYTTAKAAVHGLTRSFVTELGAAGVRINTVVPGWILTEKQRRLYLEAESPANESDGQPLNAEILPEDAASLVLFLAADDSAKCTGQEFTIDGGWI